MQLFTDTIPDIGGIGAIRFMRHTFRREEITGNNTANHMHPFCELYFLLDGEVDFRLDDKVSRLRVDRDSGERGWVVITRGGEFHSAFVRMHNYDHFYMFLDDGMLSQDRKDDFPFREFLSREPYFGNIFRPSPEGWDGISTLIGKMTNLSKSELPLKAYNEFAAALELITLVSREWTAVFGGKIMDDGRAEPENSCITSPIVRRAMTYIENNFRTMKSIASVAESCGVSQSHLSRVFHEQIGQRPSEYLRRKRLDYAKTLLMNGFDVTSACYYSGFGDYSHFIQVFRTFEGTTPLAFQLTHGVMRNVYSTMPD